TTHRPWLGISTRDWSINSDTPHDRATGGETGLGQFLDELRRTVAPRFNWRSKIARVGPHSEPLIEWITFQQHPRRHPDHAAKTAPSRKTTEAENAKMRQFR
ncbi:hypothetical protein, partial [Haloechinothrix salitolerans]